MPGNRIRRDSWRIIETVLLRYPDRKEEYKEYLENIMGASEGSSKITDPTEAREKPQSVTEAKALKLTSAYADRIEKEINAVENVYRNLQPEEQKVIRVRYWTRGKRKPIPYARMPQCSYSERQMHRIVNKVIWQVGRYIGEIN